MERENVRRAESDQPIADRGEQQRHARVVQSAQRAGRDALQAVGDEEGAPTSSSLAASEIVSSALLMPSPRNSRTMSKRRSMHDDGHQRGEDNSDRYGHQACAPYAGGITAANGVADAHGGGHADAERYHEQNGGDLQRDLMRRKRGVEISPINSAADENSPYSRRKETEIGAPIVTSCRIRLQSMRQNRVSTR